MRIESRFKPLPAEPATLLGEGKPAAAVRALRDSHGVDLRYARDWIEWHVDQDPMLRVQLETQRRAARRRLFVWFLFADAAIAAAVIYYLFYLPS